MNIIYSKTRKQVRTILLTLMIGVATSMIGIAQGIQLAQAAIDEAKGMPDSRLKDSILVHNYNYIAEAYAHRDGDRALNYIDTLKNLDARSEWSKSKGLYFRALGKYHDRSGRFEDALEYYTEAIEAFVAAGDQSEYVVYTTILKAFVLNNNGLPDACEKELETVRLFAEKLENKNYLAWIIDAFGDHYFYSGFGKQDIPKALEYYLEVEKILPGVRNQSIIADNAHCLAGCYIRLGQEKKALEYRDRALELARENDFHNITFAVYGDLADVYEENGDFDEAINYRKLSLDYAKQTSWIEMEARGESNIANTYKNAGDFENALIHFERLKSIEDSLSRYDVQTRYQEMAQKYEAGQKDLQIQKLEARNLNLMRNVLIAALILAGMFGIYYLWTNRRLRKQNQELQLQNEKIQTALVKGQNQERKRMAIELHDNVNAKIAATKWMLETLQDADNDGIKVNLMGKIMQSLDDVYEDVRFISQNLVPKDIEEKTFPTLLTRLINNLNQAQKIHFDLNITGNSYALPEFVKIQCYSMMMELISNTVKHSGGDRASVTLQYLPGQIIIDLIDNGRGFDPQKVLGGSGIGNVEARIKEVKGQIQYEKSKPHGTHVLLKIPIQTDFSIQTAGKKAPK